jgi:hypothetical protein
VRFFVDGVVWKGNGWKKKTRKKKGNTKEKEKEMEK